MIIRNRTPSKYVYYGLHLYFSGLPLRKASERLSQLFKRNHVSIWIWFQKYKPLKIQTRKRKILEYIVDETLIKIGSEYIWIWVAIEPENKEILALTKSKERNLLIGERFLSGLVKVHGKHTVSTDDGTWYPQDCIFLGLGHHIHSSFEKSIIERTIHYLKDCAESFDDYFPCRLKNRKLIYVRNWLRSFVD